VREHPSELLRSLLRRTRLSVLALAALSSLSACSKQPGEISEVRTVASEAFQRTTSAARFGFESSPPGHDHAATSSPSGLTWQVPAGWSTLPPTAMRAATFAIAAAPEIDCSLTLLPAGGGGLEANLNRWRRQMSLEPLSAQEWQALQTLPVLGRTALWLECEGTYHGMGNETPREGAKLLGVAVEDGGEAIFLKMVGPAAAVDRERGNFEALCRSFGREGGEGGNAAPVANAPAPSDAGTDAPLSWQDPPTWTREPARTMRLVSFTLGPNRDTECYVTMLEGAAGGLAANVNRWRQQMAQPALTPSELAALTEIPMLGTRGRLVQIRGDFTGMDGVSRSRSMMLGAVCELGDRSVFVKMIGPEADVAAEQERFAAFCRSLQ